MKISTDLFSAIICISAVTTNTAAFVSKPTRNQARITTLLHYIDESKDSIDKSLATNVKRHISPERVEAAIRPRQHSMFLAEKAASLFDQNHKKKIHSKDEVKTKERVVVLGSGWGAASLLKNIDTDKFDVTVVSPRNHFVFTPMLAGAGVGTVEYRSITQPIREINQNVRYLEAAATDIDPEKNVVSCASIACEGNTCGAEEFDLEFDRLIFTVGAKTTTFGIPGVEEYCNFLKQIEDAHQIKNAIVNCFESAGLPNLTEEERKKELTFVVVGAGPAGTEFAAELMDFIEGDGPRFYADLLKYVSVKIVEASDTVLRPFDNDLRQNAIQKLTRALKIKGIDGYDIQPTEFLLNKKVIEVTENSILFGDGEKLPYGMCLWAAGNGPLPITTNMIESLEGTDQQHSQEFARGRLAVDPWLRVIGGKGRVFAFGDCSCVSSYPRLPATAQVAAQQGEFLGKLLSRDYEIDANDESGMLLPPLALRSEKTLSERIAAMAMHEDEIAAPFMYLDLGILTYTGHGSALAQMTFIPEDSDHNKKAVHVNASGKIGFDLWRTIYLLKQTSPKNAALITLDWVKTTIFGRDIGIM